MSDEATLVFVIAAIAIVLMLVSAVAASRKAAAATKHAEKLDADLRSSRAELQVAARHRQQALQLTLELAESRAQLAQTTERADSAERAVNEAIALGRGIQTLTELRGNAERELLQVREALAFADDQLEAKEFDIYPRTYPDENTGQLRERMSEIRAQQSEIKKKGQIVIRFGASLQAKLPAPERARMKSLVRLARLALEGAIDVLLEKVKASNVARLEQQFGAVVTDLNRTLNPWELEIGKNYQATVRNALFLQSDFIQQQEKERDEQRALKEQMREEAAAQREAERAQREAEAEERRALRELQRAQEAAASATVAERDKWLSRVAELEAALAEAHTQSERAVAMAQLTKRGHVYIISNIGSFGDDVFKVGMTRRLDPLDRIAELGDASVPFPFDIHGLIPSDDCPALEYRLHEQLDPFRVNLVNERKEFFRLSLAELSRIVGTAGCTIQLTETAEAVQFRQSVAMRAGKRATIPDLVDEIGADEPDDDQELVAS